MNGTHDEIVDFYCDERDNDIPEENEETDAAEEVWEDALKSSRSLLLTVLQLIVCTLMICGAFVVRTIGGEIHSAVGTWFYKNYNSTIFTGAPFSPPEAEDSVTVTQRSELTPELQSAAESSDDEI